MSTSHLIHASAYTQALAAAKAVVEGQDCPQGALYVVATPIGNLADISLRALYLLGLADTIACEDTRHTGQMLHAYGLHKPLLALHEYNELSMAGQLIALLQANHRVAYVSDAGTPAISDPGSRLVAAVVAAGCRVIPIAGASSVTALLSAAGCVADDETSSGFVFLGFLPPKGSAREQAIASLEGIPSAVVILEAPHRIEALAQSLAQREALRERRITIGRELTKQFESIVTLPTAELPTWLAAKTENTRGEFAMVIHPKIPLSQASRDAPSSFSTTVTALLTRLLQDLPLKTAVQVAMDLTGQPKNALYDQALKLKDTA